MYAAHSSMQDGLQPGCHERNGIVKPHRFVLHVSSNANLHHAHARKVAGQ